MKRLGSSDSQGALMSMCPNSKVDVDEHNQRSNNPMYARDFQTMLEGFDEEGCVEECGQVSEKKRRLSVDQVKALEKNFEVENKLEPERKVKLAQELGLQPRQVAVWFQNRRARWKTKNLERDYGLLKANHDALKLKYETLQRDNESLLNEIQELKLKLSQDGKTESKIPVKEEALISDNEDKSKLETSLSKCDHETAAMEMDSKNCNENETIIGGAASVFCDFKDGSSDSDSSAILNDDTNNSPIAAAISSSMNIGFQFSDTNNHHKTSSSVFGDAHKGYYNQMPQFVKIEEHNFFGEESCSTLFSDDQAPTLHWYCSDEWN